MADKPYIYKYPHPAVTADSVVFSFDGKRLNVLLIERGGEPYKGCWAFPGGFVNIEESCEDGARRELMEEAGLQCDSMMQIGAYSTPDRDPRERIITVAFCALVRATDVQAADDAARAEWFPVESTPPLAFDHEQILSDALQLLRQRIHFEPIAFALLPEKFTLRQLRNIYEQILGVSFDRSNFAKKMQHFGVVQPVNETISRSPRTAVNLYRFDIDNYNKLKDKGFRLEF